MEKESNIKRILIAGKDSYIGTSVERYLMRYPDKYVVDTVDMKDTSWTDTDFGRYDVVFHVAGIAHVSNKPGMKKLYEAVNRDLAIESAKKARSEGVKQFIFMSSILVYGDSSTKPKIIDKKTVPKPVNIYGLTKLQAEEGIVELESHDFKVVVLRPPMVYGGASKGNYPRLSKLARKTPVFPDFKNERSMLYIENFCEFIKVMMDFEESGLFFPQNEDYINTSEMVSTISEVNGKRIILTRIFNPFIRLTFGLGIVKKVFGNMVYDKAISNYGNVDYQVKSFRESIEATELESE